MVRVHEVYDGDGGLYAFNLDDLDQFERYADTLRVYRREVDHHSAEQDDGALRQHTFVGDDGRLNLTAHEMHRGFACAVCFGHFDSGAGNGTDDLGNRTRDSMCQNCDGTGSVHRQSTMDRVGESQQCGNCGGTGRIAG